jgi:hypothetical protein
MNNRMACLECRETFRKRLDECPFCNSRIFVCLEGNEDPHAICDELVTVASLVRMGLPQPKRVGRPARKSMEKVAEIYA